MCVEWWMQYVHYYVCFHVDQHGDKGEELTSDKYTYDTEEVPSEDDFFCQKTLCTQ